MLCLVAIGYPCQVGSDGYCSGRDIMLLVSHVIKQDHIIKGPGDYIDMCPSSLVVICTVAVEI